MTDAELFNSHWWKDRVREEAATQLDSLLKERDALQARVKELEARCSDQTRMIQKDHDLRRIDIAWIQRLEKERDHAERKFELIVKHMADLAGGLPVEPASIDGATYIFKDPSPERTLRALQAAVKRAIDLAKDMSDKRIDALLAAASDGK